MTSTTQMMRTPMSVATEEQWKAVFPNFTTLTGSRNFIKKLMAVSLSTITYIRGIFPDRAYAERHLGGLKLKILTEGSNVEGVDRFINLINSCYDAVDKEYLNQLSIGIATDASKRDEVLEAYHLNFRYKENESSITQNSNSFKLSQSNPTVESTLWLLKNILLTNEVVDPLPKTAYMTMKLLYNDAITPSNYEPPGFEPSDQERFIFPANSVKLQLGKVATELHGYKMYVKTALSKNSLSQLLEESMINDSQESRFKIQNEQPNGEEDFMPQPEEYSQQDFVENSARVKPTPKEIDCPCTCKADSANGVLECTFCGQIQHSVCYGILEPEFYDSEFYCIHCIHEAPTKNSQQDLIYTYEGKEQQGLCAVRRALVFCSSVKQITVFQLEKGLKCRKELARDLIERLEFEGFIKRSGQKYIVNDKKITNNGYREYFSRMEKENIKNSQCSKPKKHHVVQENGDKVVTREKKRQSNVENQLRNAELKQIEELSLKDSQEKRTTPKQRTAKSKGSRKREIEDDFEETPRPRRRCISQKSPIILK